MNPRQDPEAKVLQAFEGINAMTIEIVARASGFADQTAIVDDTSTYSFGDLLEASASAAVALLDGSHELGGANVAFMVPPSFDYVRTQWGIWRAGGTAVPLCLTHPAPELEYILDDAQPQVVVGSAEYRDRLKPLADARGMRWLDVDSLDGHTGALPEVPASGSALMLYTSGTTGRPKGVVTTHANLKAQITALVQAWEWTSDDRILLTLPLHHLHGILNVVSCALWSGATCEMLPRFDATRVWERIASQDLTLFMAVPTIYRRLTDAWEAEEEFREERSAGCRDLRLMVSGSAALPIPVLDGWREISGHTLLERYGMTEIGMALANPLHGERRPGHVGAPLPGVEVRLVNEDGEVVPDEAEGEIQIRGANVFKEYWQRPDATAESFTEDGWFRTGDIAILDGDSYRILGRESVDIIKTGGEKVSALEIEAVLRNHPSVSEVAVVGVPDSDWGERIVAAIVPTADGVLDTSALSDFSRERLAPYKVPKEFISVDDLPRNAMGKVTKPEIVKHLSA